MVLSATLPPVWFNAWKHHRGFLCQQINQYSPSEQGALNNFFTSLNLLGSSVSDLYTGELSVAAIREEIVAEVRKLGVDSAEDYVTWIQQSEGFYQELILRDGSCWTLLIGNKQEYFIHIHPSRYSLHSIRVKTTLMRTALALLIWKKHFSLSETDHLIINRIRREHLALSPLKPQQSEGIYRIMALFRADSC